MTLHRWLIGLLFALWPITLPAQQASWPTNPIRVIVPYPPGSSGDIILRRLAPLVAQKLGGTVYVDNRPGANGHLAVEAVKNAAPDGYTLLLGSDSSRFRPCSTRSCRSTPSVISSLWRRWRASTLSWSRTRA